MQHPRQVPGAAPTPMEQDDSMVFIWANHLYRKHLLVKTRMCRYKHRCPYGNRCQFAHSPLDLRTPEDNEEEARHVRRSYLLDCGWYEGRWYSLGEE